MERAGAPEAGHIRLDRLLDQLPATSGEQQEELLNRICRLVFSHAFAEESVLWPATRRAVPDGEAVTAKIEQEHQEITELVAELEKSTPGDPLRPQLIDRTVAMLRQDVRDEEDDLLPRLQAALDPKQLRRLGITWELVRRTAPTRTHHPVVARRPPSNVLAGLPLSALDRTRDGVDYASRRTPPAVRRRLQQVGHGLETAARRLEHLPPLRRGERAETRTDDPDRR